jgi:hypothetical protein
MNASRSLGRTRIELLDAHVRQFFVLAELVDGPRADGEQFGYLGDPKQPITPAPEDLQVGERGRRARTGGVFAAPWAFRPYPARLRATVRGCRARVG